jgi:hypothetical protein
MLSLIADHLKSWWSIYATSALLIIFAGQRVQVIMLKHKISALEQSYAQCQVNIAIQNDAVLKMQQEGIAAQKRQEALDKVTSMFRVEQYKSIDQIRNMDASQISCDEAVEKFMPYFLSY